MTLRFRLNSQQSNLSPCFFQLSASNVASRLAKQFGRINHIGLSMAALHQPGLIEGGTARSFKMMINVEARSRVDSASNCGQSRYVRYLTWTDTGSRNLGSNRRRFPGRTN